MKIITTYGEISDKAWDWNDACDILGINPWLLNEGRADRYDEVCITIDQAIQIGLLDTLPENIDA